MTDSSHAAVIDTQQRLLRTTNPLIRKVFGRHKALLLSLLVLSVTAGIIPNLKAQIEGAVVQQVSDVLDGQRPLNAVASEPLGNLQRPGGDLASRLAAALLPNITLWAAVGVYFLLSAGNLLTEVGSTAVQSRISRDVFAVLRSAGLRRALLTDPGDLPQVQNVAGQYATAVHIGTTTVTTTYSHLLDAGRHIFALGTAVFLVGSKNVLFAVVAVALVFAQAAISVMQARRLRARRAELEVRRNALVARTDDILSKRDLVVAYERQEHYAETLESETTTYADIDRSLDISERWYGGLSQMLAEQGRLIILSAAVLVSVAGSGVGNVGDVVFVTSMYAALLGPASSLLSRYDSIRRSEGTARTFLDLLNSKSVPAASERTASEPHSWTVGSPITFEKVSFGYDDRNVLQDCSFAAPAGKTTLIVGPSGSGKTTIARLLLKFWPVRSGRVGLGGGDIATFTPHEVRAHMSYVAQEDFVVEDLVEDNLRWAYTPSALTEQQLRDVARAAGLECPPGYDDILKVPAKLLSGGGKQRLSLARMMLDQSEIIIIDEPLAGSDVFTVSELLPHFKQALKGRTVVLISHRLSFAAFADHVVVLSKTGAVKTVEEEGSPAMLRAAKGEFAKLYAAALAELDDRLAAGPGPSATSSGSA